MTPQKWILWGMSILLLAAAPLWAQLTEGGNVTLALSEKTAADLIYLREEEKLARDVYFAMFVRHKSKVFASLCVAEQKHMDAVKILIAKYGLEDPVVSNTPGAFTNPELAELYTLLTNQGSVSLKEALETGVIVEEMGISDIDEMLADAARLDVKRILANLLAGSNKHLEALTKTLATLAK